MPRRPGPSAAIDPNGPWVDDPHELVPVEPLQQRFLELAAIDGLTTTEVAYRLGWFYTSQGRRKPEERRVRRALGLEPWNSTNQNGRTYRQVSEHVTYRTAEKLCRALGVDPVDIGI